MEEYMKALVTTLLMFLCIVSYGQNKVTVGMWEVKNLPKFTTILKEDLEPVDAKNIPLDYYTIVKVEKAWEIYRKDMVLRPRYFVLKKEPQSNKDLLTSYFDILFDAYNYFYVMYLDTEYETDDFYFTVSASEAVVK